MPVPNYSLCRTCGMRLPYGNTCRCVDDAKFLQDNGQTPPIPPPVLPVLAEIQEQLAAMNGKLDELLMRKEQQ